MAFTDPQTITVGGTPITLNRTKSDGYSAEYMSADENYSLRISHQPNGKSGRTRRMARIDARVVAANPLSSVNEYKDLGVYVVVDEPEYGFDDATIDNVIDGLTAWLTAANIAKLLSQQS